MAADQRKTKSTPEGHTSLDLGLSSILNSGHAGARPESHSSQSFLSDQATLSEQASQGAKINLHPKDQFELLADSNRWLELSGKAEERLNHLGEGDLEAKLWWLYAELHILRVPLSILSAPLDSATLSFMAEGESLVDRPKLKLLASKVLQKALEGLKTQSDSALEILFKERIAKLSADKGPIIEEVVPPAVPSKERVELPLEALATQSISKKPLIYAALLVAVLMCIFLGRFVDLGSLLSQESLGSGRLVSSLSTAELILPVGERVAGLSHLDPIYYDLKDAKRKESAPLLESSNSQSANLQQPVQQLPSKEQPQDKPAVIDTSNPVEPKGVRELREAQNRQPKRARADNYAGEYDRAREPSGDGYWESEQRVPIDDTLESERARAIPVIKFNEPRYYTVIVQTSLMAKPSYYTISIAEFEPGDRVEVDAKFDNWLRVRSKHGTVGFILAQDVRE